MPKNGVLFSGYPESSSLMRGQSKINLAAPENAYKRFSIYKEGAQWKATSYRQNVVGNFTLKVPRNLLRAKKHYLYRFDVNELQEVAECHNLHAFTEAEWAVECMNKGEVDCSYPCIHNGECKQRRGRIVDDSKYWEVGYFVISNNRLIFSEHTYRFTKEIT